MERIPMNATRYHLNSSDHQQHRYDAPAFRRHSEWYKCFYMCIAKRLARRIWTSLFLLVLQAVGFLYIWWGGFGHGALFGNTTSYRQLHDHPENFVDFPFLINPKHDICLNSSLFLLIYVHTTPSNYHQRQAIRETWGNSDYIQRLYNVSSRTIFFVGKTQDPRIQHLLELESNNYHDMIQADFVDSYRNLTLKCIMALKWVSSYCDARFVLKVDDDVFVNIAALTRHLIALNRSSIPIENFVLCRVWKDSKVNRDKNSKWFVSQTEYSEKVYPPYCAGAAYVLSGDLPARMYNESMHTRFLWIDDVYMTGIVATRLKVQLIRLNTAVVLRSEGVENEFTFQAMRTLFGHVSDLSVTYRLWRRLSALSWWLQPAFLLGNPVNVTST